MSDECLMKQETVFSFYIVYQAVMRKFTLAGKTKKIISMKKKEIAKFVIQTVINLLAAVLTALGATSCMGHGPF